MENPVRTFQDKQRRSIIIGGEGNAIVAEHNSVQIGHFEFDVIDDDNGSYDLLINCNIDPNFQKCGIGTDMIKLAEDWYENFCIVDHFSQEGAAFINYCVTHVFTQKHTIVEDSRY